MFNDLANLMQLRSVVFRIRARKGDSYHKPPFLTLSPAGLPSEPVSCTLPPFSFLCPVIISLHASDTLVESLLFYSFRPKGESSTEFEFLLFLHTFSTLVPQNLINSHNFFFFYNTAIDRCRCRGYNGLWCSFASIISLDQPNSRGTRAAQGWPPAVYRGNSGSERLSGAIWKQNFQF